MIADILLAVWHLRLPLLFLYALAVTAALIERGN